MLSVFGRSACICLDFMTCASTEPKDRANSPRVSHICCVMCFRERETGIPVEFEQRRNVQGCSKIIVLHSGAYHFGLQNTSTLAIRKKTKKNYVFWQDKIKINLFEEISVSCLRKHFTFFIANSEYNIRAYSPYLVQYVDHFETFKRSATKMVKRFHSLSNKKIRRKLERFSVLLNSPGILNSGISEASP